MPDRAKSHRLKVYDSIGLFLNVSTPIAVEKEHQASLLVQIFKSNFDNYSFLSLLFGFKFSNMKFSITMKQGQHPYLYYFVYILL